MYAIAKQGQINRKIDRYDRYANNKIFTTILCESSKHNLEYDNKNYFYMKINRIYHLHESK